MTDEVAEAREMLSKYFSAVRVLSIEGMILALINRERPESRTPEPVAEGSLRLHPQNCSICSMPIGHMPGCEIGENLKTLDAGSGGSAETATREDADRGADGVPRARSAQPSEPVHHAEDCERCEGDGYVNPGLHEKDCPDCRGTGKRVEPAAGEASTWDDSLVPVYFRAVAEAGKEGGSTVWLQGLAAVAQHGYNAGKAATWRAAELLHRLIEQNPRYAADEQLQADLIAWHGGTFGKSQSAGAKCKRCAGMKKIPGMLKGVPFIDCPDCHGTGRSPEGTPGGEGKAP